MSAGCFVDVERGFVHLAQGKGQPRPLVVVEAAGTHTVRVEPADRGEHAHGQLGAAHFHRENRHRQTDFNRHVLGHVERQRGFAHRRATGDDQQVAGLQTRGLGVEIVVAGRHPGDVRGVVSVMQFLDAFDDLREQRIDVHKTGLMAEAALGNGKDLGFGLVEQLLRIAAERVERAAGDLVAGGDQLAQYGTFADDFGVAPDVRRRRRIGRQFAEVGQAAGFAALAGQIEAFRYRNDVDRLAAFEQLADLAIDAPVFVAIEIASPTRSAILSKAALSSSKPPSTDCSASIECGGMRRWAIAGSIARLR